MAIAKKSFRYGEHTVTLETGAIARQATGAVWVSMDDTVVLVTVVGQESNSDEKDFFPMFCFVIVNQRSVFKFSPCID